jgi:hypothetical protein
MRSSIVLLAGIVGLLGSGLVAFADPETPSSAAATTTAANPPDAASAGTPQSDWNDIICKTMAPATGTRLGARRACQTKHEWDLQQQEAQRELEHQQNGASAGVPGN